MEGMSGFDFGFAESPQHSFLLPPTVDDVTNHLLTAHGDPKSSACTRPCLLDDPRLYSNCPMPLCYNDGSFNNHYGFVGSGPQLNQYFVECGAKIHAPEAYIAYFNAHYRLSGLKEHKIPD